MPKNPDGLSLEDIRKMDDGEFRQFVFLKLNNIDGTVRKLDTRVWAVLAGILVTIATVVVNALV
jgi:hypothetical protein